MEFSWLELRKRYEYLSQELTSPLLDSSKRHLLQKERSRLSLLLEKYDAQTETERLLDDARRQYDQTTDSGMRELFKDEIALLQEQLSEQKRELDDLLFPPDELDMRSVFLEIRAGTGGQEAALFAADLLKMYTNYALKCGWHVSLVDSSQTDLGGIREATLYIDGKGAYAHLKHEAGVHRVQRVPKTETSGRVHTSTATVAVLPEAQEVEYSISASDLRIDTYRAGGAGGQHVNKTESAIRITHIPTGTVVTCQEERSQHKNKARAMKMLQSRLLVAQKEKQESEESQKRKEMVGAGMRAEKLRTYNFPQNRVTDHQVDLTLKKLDMVIEGGMDEIIQALMLKEQQERRKKIKPFN